MPIPTRPVAGAAIATSWGTDVHDRVFAPKGCRVAGALTSIFGNDAAWRVMDLATASDDPGGWLSAGTDTIVVPTGAEGLYIINCQVTATGGVSTAIDHIALERNSVVIGRDAAGAESPGVLAVTTVYPLVATDVIRIRARQTGTGLVAHNGAVATLQAVRIGDDWGA